jgi:hypothetical protein
LKVIIAVTNKLLTFAVFLIEGGIIMSSVMSAIRNTIPINQFNRGLAGKIFEDVKKPALR